MAPAAPPWQRLVNMLTALGAVLLVALAPGMSVQEEAQGSLLERAGPAAFLSAGVTPPHASRGGPRTGCKRVLWFMGLSEKRDEEVHTMFWNQLVVSMRSARRHAPSLQPILIWLAPPNERSARFEQHGGIVLYPQQLTFHAILEEAVAQGWRDKAWLGYEGAYARLDAPLLSRRIRLLFNPEQYETDYILYTDVDVIFFKDIDSCTLPRPAIMMYGGETGHNETSNTGVVWMNVSAMIEHRKGLLEFAREQRWDFMSFDQGLLNSYFAARGLVDVLPDEFNWKVYWGRHPGIAILHFHGPKPAERCYQCFYEGVQDYAANASCGCTNPAFQTIFSWAEQVDGAGLVKDAFELYNQYSAATEHSRHAARLGRVRPEPVHHASADQAAGVGGGARRVKSA